jgi:N-acylneuraminate cytidylyltransferase
VVDNASKKKVLAIIPARGGSKGIPRKNIRDLCGKPLIAYSIEAAVKSRLINRIIVSTDDEEIAQISKSFGAEVPFMRPVRLAEDRSDMGSVLHYTVSRLMDQEYEPDIIVHLYPTHPFRTPALIDFLITKILEGFSPVATFKKITHTPVTIFSRNGGNLLTPLLAKSVYKREDLKYTYFRQYGLFSGTGHGADNFYVHVIRDPSSLIDIDTMSDFYLAEEVIKQGLFDFNLSDPDKYISAG